MGWTTEITSGPLSLSRKAEYTVFVYSTMADIIMDAKSGTMDVFSPGKREEEAI
jgi:hypothetical protein